MTNEERNQIAIDAMKFFKQKLNNGIYGEFVGNFDTAISALEKQIPKNPIEDDYYDEPAVCPNCGGNVINMADNDYHFQHCHYCGQALKWRDSE